jgi:rhodanese-related sulfurtransferase
MVNKLMSSITSYVFGFIFASVFSFASEVKISENLAFVEILVDGKTVKIERIKDTTHKLNNNFTKTSRVSPPFTIQPFVAVEGVETVTELDVLRFLKKDFKNNEGILIDARLEKWVKKGSIPGAINIPFTMLTPEGNNSLSEQVLELFGAVKKDGVWNFSEAQTLLVFDNGPWCQQGVQAIKNILQHGYPKSKIKYYRGGMQYWYILGLTTAIPN